MLRIALASAVALALAGGAALAQGVAQGVAPGGPVGGSTGIGSGLGGVTGTGPSWPNGTNQAPQPSIPSVPPGGYASPAPSSTYMPPRPSVAAPSTAPPTYRQPNEPYATSGVRPPATIPLVLPQRPTGSLAFLKGCWRTDSFPDGQHRGTVTWCFDDKGSGRYLYTFTDRSTDYYCHAQAQAAWEAGQLQLVRRGKTSCDDDAGPAALTCREGTDGALCSGAGKAATVRLYRVR